MKVPRWSLLLALPLFLCLDLAAQSRPTYTVGSVKEFLQRLGPDRTIVLKKGDYRLWTAYGQSGPGFAWLEGEDGSELSVEGADNLTIRGMDGARILTNSLSSYLLSFHSSSRIELDNLVLARELDGDELPEAGILYAEDIDRLSVTRCRLTGPSGYPLEIWDGGAVDLVDTTIEGGSLGAISLSLTRSFTAKGGRVSGIDGWPLLYVEEGGPVSFEGTTFAGNSGGSFVEIYPAEGEEASVLFSRCRFQDDDFEYFAGTPALPETRACVFEGSSFDEDWEEYSVDFGGGDDYYDDYMDDGEGRWAFIDHYDGEADLGFSYPEAWDFQEGSEPGRVAVFSDSGDGLVFFAKALAAGRSYDPAREGEALLVRALGSVSAILGEEGGMSLTVASSGVLVAAATWHEKEYRGHVTTPDGQKSAVRFRLALRPAGVWLILAIADAPELLEDGGDLETVLSSLFGG